MISASSRRRDLKQSHSMRTKRRPIAIINRNHVLIRLPPSRRRMEFSEATRSDTLLLRGHVAEVVTLAEHNSVVAQDVVGSGDVEIEVRKRETGQVLAGREAHRFRADLHLDGALCSGEKSVRRV